MPIKSIVVHVANDPQHRERLEFAISLAERFAAHLSIVFVTTPVSMPAAIEGRGASAAYIAEARAVAREKAEALRREVEEIARGPNLAYGWIVENGDPVERLAHHAQIADLAIVGQSESAHLEDRVVLHQPEQLVLQAGCPVLVVPQGGKVAHGADFARRVLIAWKDSKQASDAVREAIPFLATADEVFVLTCSEGGSTAGTDVARYLSHHGIRSETHHDYETGSNVGEAILAKARHLGCDLLVMGAYGRSRLAEILFGGTTRHIVRHTTIPILMAH